MRRWNSHLGPVVRVFGYILDANALSLESCDIKHHVGEVAHGCRNSEVMFPVLVEGFRLARLHLHKLPPVCYVKDVGKRTRRTVLADTRLIQ